MDQRLIGVAIPDVSDYVQPQPEGKWSQLFSALARRTDFVGVGTPRVSKFQERLQLLAAVPEALGVLGQMPPSPFKARLRATAGFDVFYRAKYSRILRRQLEARRENFDTILQLQTLFMTPPGIPYVIYTDNTMAITQAHAASYAPMSDSRSLAWQMYEGYICRAAEKVFTTSEFTRHSMIIDYGCDPDRVLAVGAGANQMISSLDQRTAGYALNSPPRALFVGYDFNRKGGPELLEAWPLVRECLPTARLVIVGPKHDPVGPGNGLGIEYVGRVSRKTLTTLYLSSNVFVMPSLFEPWGFVFAEAMGHGLPCIASRVFAMPEQITEGVSGRLVKPGSIADLADALVDLLGDPARAMALGDNAHAVVKATMTWDHVADRLVNFL